MLKYTREIKNQKDESPLKIKEIQQIQGVLEIWLKYYSSATAMFKGRGKSLDSIGFLGWKRRIYTLFTPLEDRIGSQDVKKTE